MVLIYCREEDHDYSDEEDENRIKFSVDNRDEELRKMHRTLHEAMDEEEGSDHENAWEEQQIRKGVNILMVSWHPVFCLFCARRHDGPRVDFCPGQALIHNRLPCCSMEQTPN